ncbi:MAG TPA: ferritin [Phycisphaerae bacterium]|nr:ferritin [Phycisphaerae bacterium]HOJ75053.1 ferritin [Phycisphaerae bacterium]HOM51924.1 ferritin [Phycisphaerae bacterium]HON67218.1 ferritin [Phycisphaerae bacterium]HOQ86138.1 ferritin [Phycisphaerae bacterium]
MLSQKMQAAFNEQIRNEIASGYLYLAMSAYLESQNFGGAAHWMREQYKEELDHAAKLFKHVTDRSGRVVLEAIEKPPVEFGSLKEVFQAVLAHEQKVTGLINKLYETALAEKDYPAQIELQWFIKEQVEEEKTVEDILAQIEACDGKPHLLLMIDHHLGKRGQ